eukprot:gnl/Dysnectes_brevis/1352_a1519_2270.p1 GENE.gnl/Dysnectes_brevis/1352_a1519_2270~~gnl/Dysnectes_brevis/1352_a1519_2270.p1  ORF type:complete len:326 (+),score=80.35 gnl/Dysnectes_brevis/1352_a1519_2270:51-1028(+)
MSQMLPQSHYVQEDREDFLTQLKAMNESFDSVIVQAEELHTQLSSDSMPTTHGMTLFDAKNLLLASYLHDLTAISTLKLSGKSFSDSEALRSLIETRVAIDKVLPLEKRARQKVDRLLRAAVGDAQKHTTLNTKTEQEPVEADELFSDDSSEEEVGFAAANGTVFVDEARPRTAPGAPVPQDSEEEAPDTVSLPRGLGGVEHAADEGMNDFELADNLSRHHRDFDLSRLTGDEDMAFDDGDEGSEINSDCVGDIGPIPRAMETREIRRAVERKDQKAGERQYNRTQKAESEKKSKSKRGAIARRRVRDGKHGSSNSSTHRRKRTR